jgi:hypothetical protein
MTIDEKGRERLTDEDVQNVFSVAKTDHGVCVVKPPTVSITKMQAANLAAWLVVMAGPETALYFPVLLQRASEIAGLGPERLRDTGA